MFKITPRAAEQILQAARQGGTEGMALRFAARQKEDGIHVNDPHHVDAPDNPQLVEGHRDQNGHKQLEETFHPKVDNPETPRVHQLFLFSLNVEGGLAGIRLPEVIPAAYFGQDDTTL